jgi:hypothetical protein
MVDNSSHYEYLAIYVDDILIWSKDPMAVIKSSEKTYMLNIYWYGSPIFSGQVFGALV